MRLRLYVTGASGLSLRAMANIKSICRDYLEDLNPDLQIIDLYRHPSSARANQIFAAPTLIKEFPLPVAGSSEIFQKKTVCCILWD